MRNIAFNFDNCIKLVLFPLHDAFRHSLIQPFHKYVLCASHVLSTELGSGRFMVSGADTYLTDLTVCQKRQPKRQLLSLEVYPFFSFFQTHQAYLSASMMMPAIAYEQPPSSPWHLYVSA